MAVGQAGAIMAGSSPHLQLHEFAFVHSCAIYAFLYLFKLSVAGMPNIMRARGNFMKNAFRCIEQKIEACSMDLFWEELLYYSISTMLQPVVTNGNE